MSKRNISLLVKEAMAVFNSLSPEQQLAHRKLQQESYVRGELAMGSDADELAARQKEKKDE